MYAQGYIETEEAYQAAVDQEMVFRNGTYDEEEYTCASCGFTGTRAEYTETDGEYFCPQCGEVNNAVDKNHYYSYFVDTVWRDVVDALVERYGYSELAAEQKLLTGGYKIYATIDPEVQAIVDKVYENLDNVPILENESGALSRVIGLFSQRGYNIESLTVAPTDDPTLSRMTIQTVGDEKVLEQIEKQLHKLVDVLRVSELGQGAHVEREIMLVKIQASGYGRDEVKRNTEIFRGQIIDVTPSLYTVQLAGTSDKLDAFLASIRDVAKIVEVARSGVVGLSRGDKIMR